MSDAGSCSDGTSATTETTAHFFVESPHRAMERYRHALAENLVSCTGPHLTGSHADDVSGNSNKDGDADDNNSSGITSFRESGPGCVVDHPQVIAEVLGYSWNESYYDETPHQRRLRWLQHQSFGQVVISEGGTSPSTAVSSSAPASSADAALRHGKCPPEYAERFFSTDVWAYRPAAMGPAPLYANRSSESPAPCSSSSPMSTAGTASEMVVSVAVPPGRKRGATVTNAEAASTRRATVAKHLFSSLDSLPSAERQGDCVLTAKETVPMCSAPHNGPPLQPRHLAARASSVRMHTDGNLCKQRFASDVLQRHGGERENAPLHAGFIAEDDRSRENDRSNEENAVPHAVGPPLCTSSPEDAVLTLSGPCGGRQQRSRQATVGASVTASRMVRSAQGRQLHAVFQEEDD